MAKTDFSYRLTATEMQDKYSVEKTASISIDAELSKNYSEKAIQKAKQLKAKHGEKYSDEQYLRTGKTMVSEEVTARYGAIHKNRVNNCNIKDIDWAIYTYEEIIAMETDGYEIPEDILQWAHSQQEADVTNYVIVSDATANSDNLTAANGTPKDELNHLQTKAKQNISKSETAMENVTKSLEEYQLIADKAKEIKQEKENTYKNKLEEISSMTEEWKKLDEKSKSGKLTKSEKDKYKALSKQLNGKDGTLMTEIQVDNTELDKFLKNLDGLNEEITQNLTLAKDTIDSGIELSKYEKNYNSNQLPVATSGQIYDGKGLSSDTLYAVKGEEISDLAIEKGTELDEQSNNISSDLNTGDNANLNNFAKEYTSLATQAENNTKNVMGENFEKSNQDTENEQQQAEKQSKEHSVEMKFTYQNAQKAAATTALATVQLIPQERGVKKSDKELQKELKTIQKDAATLANETSKTEEKIIKNNEEQEKIKTKINEIEKETETTGSENSANTIEAVTADGTETTEQTGVISEDNKNTEKTNKKENLKDELIDTQDDGKDLTKDVSKALNKSSKSTSKGENLTKALNKANNELEIRNKNEKDVAEKTVVVGTGTVTKSFVTSALGTTLEATGSALMSNPITFTKGAVLLALGIILQAQGEKELKYGLLAAGTGALGLVTGAIADETKTNATETEKTANQIFKSNKQEIKDTSNLIGEEVPKTDNATSETEETTATNNGRIDIIKSQAAAATTTENETSTEDSSNEIATQEPQQVDETNIDENLKTEDNTEQTENNENKETTEESKESSEKTEGTEKQQNQQSEGYSVDIAFNSPNAIRATATAIQATADLFNDDSKVLNTQKEVDKNTKDSQKAIKNVSAESAKTASEQEANAAEANSIDSKITIAQNEIETAQTEEEAILAQNKVTNLSTQLDSTISKDEQITSSANKSISNSIKQLNNFKESTNGLSEELNSFDKTMLNQLDVSKKTLTVGMGTGAVGMIDSNVGAGLIISGLGLMSNPLTFSMGVAQQITGKALLAKGLLEITTGTAATVAGASGIVAHEIAEKDAQDSETTLKTAQNKNKELEEKTKADSDNINDNQSNTDNENNSEQPLNTQESESTMSSNILVSQAASVTTNANINDTTTTDDKADRKLSRFNTESIIESKKKKKKVQAVSASSGNKA